MSMLTLLGSEERRIGATSSRGISGGVVDVLRRGRGLRACLMWPLGEDWEAGEGPGEVCFPPTSADFSYTGRRDKS